MLQAFCKHRASAGGEFYFKLSASSVAKPGRVTFVFKNVGSVDHDFSIDGVTTPIIGPGKTARLTVTLAKPGKYPYECTITGYAAAGMKGPSPSAEPGSGEVLRVLWT